LAACAFAQRQEFAVASVKRNTANGPINTTPERSGDLVTWHNISPFTAILYAWHLRGAYQMVGYPEGKAALGRYDIDARVGHAATDDEVRLMMQSLLEDRFRLKAHQEIRDTPDYELTVYKAKPKVKPSDSQEPWSFPIDGRTFHANPGRCTTTLWSDGAHMICHSAPLDVIAREIDGELGMPVIDHTGLAGTYDLHMRFRWDGNPVAEGPDDLGARLEQAVREELGLKLERHRGKLQVLVIDCLEKPTVN
jgi:uncharacterized protein (TIGR03435 family)